MTGNFNETHRRYQHSEKVLKFRNGTYYTLKYGVSVLGINNVFIMFKERTPSRIFPIVA